MINDSTLNLLINAGVAGVFAVFAYAIFKEFLNFLAQETATRRSIMAEANQQFAALSREVGKLIRIIERISVLINLEEEPTKGKEK